MLSPFFLGVRCVVSQPREIQCHSFPTSPRRVAARLTHRRCVPMAGHDSGSSFSLGNHDGIEPPEPISVLVHVWPRVYSTPHRYIQRSLLESNQRPADYKSAALPSELRDQLSRWISRHRGLVYTEKPPLQHPHQPSSGGCRRKAGSDCRDG